MPRAPRKNPPPAHPPTARSRRKSSKGSALPGRAGGQGRFEDEAPPILSTLRESLAALVRALPNQIDGPRDLERALGIDYVLAWRTYKVATAADSAAVGADVPRPAPMKRLLDAAKRRRIRAAIIEKVRSAYADFENLVHRHAGDDPKRGPGSRPRSGGRAVFDALISGIDRGTSPVLDLHHRRAAFKSNGYLWGVQALAALRCVIWHEGEQSGQIDGCLLSAYAQLHALRADVPVILKHQSRVTAPPNLRPPSDIRLLGDFCSKPQPELVTDSGADGYSDVRLRFEGVGKGAAIDCATLEAARNVNNGIPQVNFSVTATAITPSETLTIILAVPRGWSDPASATVGTYGHPTLTGAARTGQVSGAIMPTREPIEHFHAEFDALNGPDFPRLSDMFRAALAEQRWQATAFDIYRCRIRYPILHTLIRLQVSAAQNR